MSCLAQYSALDNPLDINSWHNVRQNASRSTLLMNFGTRRLRIAISSCDQRQLACSNFIAVNSCSLIDAYDNPNWHARKLKREVESLPEAHIKIKEFVELTMRPNFEY